MVGSPPVGVEHQSVFQTIGLPGEIRRKTRVARLGNQRAILHFLEGRNFRHIDYVVELDVARPGDDLGVVIDAEVAHRVRVSGVRNPDRRTESNHSC